MRILIDFMQIPVQKVGVGVYALNLISKIYEIDRENTYYLFVQDDDDSFDFIKDDHFKLIKVKSKFFRKPSLIVLLGQVYIPYLALKYKIDIVHSLHYIFPIFVFAKKVIVIYDMTFFNCPQYHVPAKVYFFRFFIYLASFLADRIVADSKSSLDDFLQKFKVDRKKTRVIYLGKSELFNPDLNTTRIENIKNKYKTGEKYLLFIGTIEPRKNIKNLILAFHRFSLENNDYKLVIAGKKGWYFQEVFRLPEKLGLNEKVIFTGFIDEEDKPYLIAAAKIFIYPSMYEGFGLPVLESLSCGVPTITSNISSLPEIAGDAALLINPASVDELYLNIKRLLSDEVLYARLKRKSIEQAKKFSWEKTAQETLEVYRSLL